VTSEFTDAEVGGDRRRGDFIRIAHAGNSTGRTGSNHLKVSAS
jgi:hypothetical protein